MNITIDYFESWDGYTIFWVYQGTPMENIEIVPEDLCYYLEGAIDLVADMIHEDPNSIVHSFLDEEDISKEDIEEAFRDSWTYNEDAGWVDWEEEPPAELVIEETSFNHKIYRFQKI